MVRKIFGPRYDRNEYIRAREVRVIDSNGENLGVMDTRDAVELARSKQLDLVLISPNEEVPVAKITDWSKFKYQLSKKSKQKGKSASVKEWWFKPKIAEHDIMNKLNNLQKHLDKGGKAKVTIRFMRRALPDDMYTTLNKVLSLSEGFSDKASEVLREGRNLSVFLTKKK